MNATEQKPIVKFSINDANIAELADNLKGRSADTPDGYKLVMSGLSECRRIRVEIRDRKKELNEDALEWQRGVNTEAKRLIGRIEKIEEPLKASRKEADDIAAAIEFEKQEVLRKKREAEEQEVRDLAKAKEEKERAEKQAEIDAQREKLETEQVELIRYKEKLAEQKAKDDEALQKLHAELAEQKSESDAILQRERDRDRIEQKEKDRLQRIKAEKQNAEEDAEAREKHFALLLQDIAVLENYREAVNAVPMPEITNSVGARMLDSIVDGIGRSLSIVVDKRHELTKYQENQKGSDR